MTLHLMINEQCSMNTSNVALPGQGIFSHTISERTVKTISNRLIDK